MTLFQRIIYHPDSAGGLCRTCSWGTVRVGFFRGEAEIFCRLVGLGSRLRFAVRDCTDYCDRCAPVTALGERKYSFMTGIKRKSGEISDSPEKVTELTTK